MNAELDPIAKFANAYLETYKSGDIDARLALFADDATFEDPVGTLTLNGHAEIGAFWRQVDYSTSKFVPELLEVVQCGDEGIFRFTQLISMQGQPTLLFKVIEVVALGPDGKARSLRAFWNDASVSSPKDHRP
jgi:steroid Delta-isomerase